MNSKAIRLVIEVVEASAAGRLVAVPEACRLLWRWFTDLSATRTYHAAGPNPISYTEIVAYADATRTPLRAEDVAAIRRIDDAWIGATYRTRTSVTKTLPLDKGQPLTAAAFDAVWG